MSSSTTTPPRDAMQLPIALSLVMLAGVSIAGASRLPGFPIEFLYAFLVSGALRVLLGRSLDRLAPRAVLQGLGTVLAIVAVFWLIGRMRGGAATVLVGGLAVLAAMQALLILSNLRDRNALYGVIVISTVHVVGTGGLTKDLPTLGLSVLYTGVLLWTFLLLERDRRSERPAKRNVHRVRFSGRHPLPTGVALRTFALLLLVGFPLGLVLYFVTPRLGDAKPSHDFDQAAADAIDERELFEGRRLAREFMTGPSDESQFVEFGSVGKIKQSHLPVLQVQHKDGRRPERIYLRDNVLDRYEPAGRWRSSPSLNAAGARVLRPDADGWFALEPDAGIAPSWRTQVETLQVTTLKSGFGRWYLMPWPLRARILRGLPDPRPVTRCRIHKLGSHTLTLRVPGAARHQFHEADVIEFEYVSQRRPDSDLTGRVSDARVSPIDTYVEIPADTLAALEPIARQVVGRQSDPWRRARRLEAWLKSPEFDYTLAVPVLDPNEKVVDFLVNVKRGHCEIYASALVMLLRSLGHPARYARGFWGGDRLGIPDSEIGSVVMRLSHYHAWTEIYLDQVGWVALNPTPPDRTPSDAAADEHALGEGVDADGNPIPEPGAEHPNVSILEFGRDEYDRFWSGVGESIVDGVRGAAKFLFSSASGYLGVILLVLSVAIGGYIQRRQAVRNVATSGGGSIPRGPYGRALLVLAKRGVRRPAHQTPRELVHWVSQVLPAAVGPLATITGLFERERYGGEPDAASGRDARRALAALSDAVKRTPGE